MCAVKKELKIVVMKVAISFSLTKGDREDKQEKRHTIFSEDQNAISLMNIIKNLESLGNPINASQMTRHLTSLMQSQPQLRPSLLFSIDQNINWVIV